MKNDGSLSVIVSIYNVKQYLPQCIQSIVDSLYDKLDIILVDDGSTDGSGGICDEYARSHDNIRVIHKENGGLVSARKAGAGIAAGEYLTFVDGDDYVEKELYAEVMETLKQSHADILSIGFQSVYEDGGRITYRNELESGIYEKAKIRESILPGVLPDRRFKMRLAPSVWGKFIKREIFVKNMLLVEDNVVVSEDTVFSLVCIKDAKTYEINNDITGYCYRQRAGSISRGGVNRRYWREVENFCKNLDKLYAQFPEVYSRERLQFAKLYMLVRVLNRKIMIDLFFRSKRSKDIKEALQNDRSLGCAVCECKVSELAADRKTKMRLTLIQKLIAD